MKATASTRKITEKEFAVPSEIVLVALLLGTAIAGILAHTGRTAPAVVFLGLSLLFVVMAGSRRRECTVEKGRS